MTMRKVFDQAKGKMNKAESMSFVIEIVVALSFSTENLFDPIEQRFTFLIEKFTKLQCLLMEIVFVANGFESFGQKLSSVDQMF